MKIYEYKIAPNPLRVQMFLSEKDINVETIQVDVRNGENRKEEYLSINPVSYTHLTLPTNREV